MSSGQPPLAGDFFGYGVQGGDGGDGGDGGQPLMSSDQMAAAAAQAQSQDDAMMLFLNDPTSFFNTFDDMNPVFDGSAGGATAGGDLGTAGSMFAQPPPPPQQQQQPLLSLATTTAPTSADASLGESSTKDAADALADVSPDSSNEQPQSQPGAGPLPVEGFNSQAALGGGAGTAGGMLTEFTRRKNWPAKVLEELCDLLQIIEPNGRIRYTSASVTNILGYTPEEAVGQALSELVHPDDRFVLLSELNACIANASQLRLYLRLRKRDGTFAVVETVGHAHIAASRFAPNPANKSPFCQAVFLMSRPYPTKNASLLDSFLEHKMENERLRRRIEDLRREEESEDRDDESHTQNQSRLWRQSIGSRSDMAASDGGGGGGGGGPNASPVFFRAGRSDGVAMPPPSAPLFKMGSGNTTTTMTTSPAVLAASTAANAALTRENLEGIAARRPDWLRDKMARYEGMAGPAAAGAAGPAGPGQNGKRVGPGLIGPASHADTIEMLTGLRYQEGERSRGLSTGNRSPQLIKGDAGIAFSVNRDQRSGEKKKKIRLAEEYVCTDCGTLESPEWRKGPSGPKTLCNACGLRWAKKEKKEKKKAAAAGVAGMAGAASAGPSTWEEQ